MWLATAVAQGSQGNASAPDTPAYYLAQIAEGKYKRARFMELLCKEADIGCRLITGTRKGPTYQLGSKITDDDRYAEWNALVIDGEWQLADVDWASKPSMTEKSFVFTVPDEEVTEESPQDATAEKKDCPEGGADDRQDPQLMEYFFLTDPNELIYSHFPDDEEWQLLQSVVSWDTFRGMPNLKGHYFIYGMSPADQTPDRYILQTDNGEVGLYHNVPAESYRDLIFKFHLTTHRKRRQEDGNLDQFVFFQRLSNKLAIRASFSKVGRFKLSIFGGRTNDSVLNMVCAYIIDCAKPKEQCRALPDNPNIGFGAGVEAEELGLFPKSHTDGFIETEDGNVKISFTMKGKLDVSHTLKNNDFNEETLKKQTLMRVDKDKGEVMIELRLPQKGEYALKLFASQEGKDNALKNVCNYLILCHKKDKTAAYPKLQDGFVGEGFICDEMEIRAISHKDYVVDTLDGQLNMIFTCPAGVDLYYELDHSKKERKYLLEQVQKSCEADQTIFLLNLQDTGEYGLNIYAKKEKQPDAFCAFSYLIRYINDERTSPQRSSKKKEQDIPIEHITTEEAEAKVKMHKARFPLVAQFRMNNSKQAMEVKSAVKGIDVMFKVKLPSVGDYTMDIYEAIENLAFLQMKTYIISRRKKEVVQEPTPKADNHTEEEMEEVQPETQQEMFLRLRDDLDKALDEGDAEMLEKAINEYEANKVPEEEDELQKAKEYLPIWQMNESISTAMKEHDIARLEADIQAAEREGLDGKLNISLDKARDYLAQLKRLEQLRQPVLAVHHISVAELKSYDKPPPIVHQVMVATLMLLGDDRKRMKTWRSARKRIGLTTTMALNRRITEFHVEDLDEEVVLKAKDILDQYTAEEALASTWGLLTFYEWSQGVIAEFLEQNPPEHAEQVSKVRDTQPASAAPATAASKTPGKAPSTSSTTKEE